MARNFCNKIWNASRFVLMNLGEGFAPNPEAPARVQAEGSLAERWVLSRYGDMLARLSAALAEYQMAEAARAVHSFFWSEFCDWFVELCKPPLREGGAVAQRARETLHYLLEGTLRALHPFMPFITEEIWQQLPGAGESIMVSRWPQADPAWRDQAAEAEMDALMAVVTAARKLRADQGVAPSARVGLTVLAASAEARRVVEANREAILSLVRGRALMVGADLAGRPAIAESLLCAGEPALVAIDAAASEGELRAHQERLEKELARLAKEEQRLAQKLANAEFLARAPEPVVEKARNQLAHVKERRETAAAQLAEVKRVLRS